MGGARQGSDRRRDRGMEIGLGADHHPRGEGGCVAAVLGVENEVAIHQPGGLFRGLAAGHHGEKVRRVGKAGVGLRQWPA